MFQTQSEASPADFDLRVESAPLHSYRVQRYMAGNPLLQWYRRIGWKRLALVTLSCGERRVPAMSDGVGVMGDAKSFSSASDSIRM